MAATSAQLLIVKRKHEVTHIIAEMGGFLQKYGNNIRPQHKFLIEKELEHFKAVNTKRLKSEFQEVHFENVCTITSQYGIQMCVCGGIVAMIEYMKTLMLNYNEFFAKQTSPLIVERFEVEERFRESLNRRILNFSDSEGEN